MLLKIQNGDIKQIVVINSKMTLPFLILAELLVMLGTEFLDGSISKHKIYIKSLETN